jgi:hypothetical protein
LVDSNDVGEELGDGDLANVVVSDIVSKNKCYQRFRTKKKLFEKKFCRHVWSQLRKKGVCTYGPGSKRGMMGKPDFGYQYNSGGGEVKRKEAVSARSSKQPSSSFSSL